MRSATIKSLFFGLHRRKSQNGFSLIEVVVATGICTYALLVIASLLPVGLVSIQAANRRVMQTEIFNQIWSEVNTTPYSSLTTYPRLVTPSYFDGNALETNAASGIFFVTCSQPTVALSPSSGGAYAANELNAVQVKIGYHVDPRTVTDPLDPRVSTRTFVVTRRDGSTTSVLNGW